MKTAKNATGGRSRVSERVQKSKVPKSMAEDEIKVREVKPGPGDAEARRESAAQAEIHKNFETEAEIDKNEPKILDDENAGRGM